jgi:hypothetical protein
MNPTPTPLDAALAVAATLKGGAWPAVETFSMLAIEAQGRPESLALLERARQTAAGLLPGSWDSVRGLTWLARAERELLR